jgi:cyclopropane-fatty-acyl-phospholipid synthase
MLIELAERRLAPDLAIRVGIRRLLRKRLQIETARAPAPEQRVAELRRQFAKGPIAESTDAARRQHYEAPTELFRAMLGPRLKYSCCQWERGTTRLADAEDAMLSLTARRAGLADGQRILDLGCGWGPLSLWAAERFPRADVVAVSNSRTQHEFILSQARARGLENVRHLVADVSSSDFAGALGALAPASASEGDERVFDRIISVEMFEHMHNVERLMHQLGDWIAPGGRLLVHVFCHRELFYRYQDEGRDDWMARHFFTGGAMPPLDLFEHLGGPFELVNRWETGGEHYARTAGVWLANVDGNRDAILRRFEQDLPPADARRRLQRWRMFLMACQELFAYDHGRQWFVSHHLLAPR